MVLPRIHKDAQSLAGIHDKGYVGLCCTIAAGGTNTPWRPVVTYVALFRVNDDVPLEVEVDAEVRRLCLNKAGGHTHLHAEHFKEWLQ